MEAASVEIRKTKGHMVVQIIGRTQRGQKYLKAQEVLGAKRITDKEFKQEMTDAVEQLLGRDA